MVEKSRRRSRTHRSNKVRIVIGAVLVLAVAAAGFVLTKRGGVNVDELMTRAEQQFRSGALEASVIDLKTVIKAQPGNRKARLLLAQIYIEAGYPQGALKEFVRSRELGGTEPSIALGIVRAMLQLGKFDEAATEIAINGDTSKPEWLVLRGALDLAQQRVDDARATFTSILAADPEHDEARRGLMQVELIAGNVDSARVEVEKLLNSGSPDAGLWVIKGDLDAHDKNFALAQEAYAKALALEPKNPVAHIAMARVLIELGEQDAAAQHLDQIGASGEDDPRVNFLRARIAEARNDTHSALLAVRKVLQMVPMHRESLVLAAKLNFSQGEFTRAQDYVRRILEIEPANAAAQRMLGAIQLAAGRMDGLDDMIAQADGDTPAQDPGMLALLGAAYLKHGKYGDSEASLARAAELAPDSHAIRTQLALSRLSNGDPAKAIEELKVILTEDPSFEQAEIMLALVHMSQRDMAAAQADAESLVAKKPQSPLAQNVLGYVLEASDNKDGARAAYESAIAKDPAFLPARINLARLAIAAGNRDVGRKHFEEVLALEPFHEFALIGLAALALLENNLDEAERLWILAREQNPDAVTPRLLLAKHYRARKNRPLAESAIMEAYRLAPYAPQVQAEYAAIMLEAGQFQDALAAAQLLVERVPNSLQGLELLARIYNHLGDEQNLTQTLAKITEFAPAATGARVLLAHLAIRRKEFERANAIASELVAVPENAALGHELGGDVLLAQSDFERARDAYLLAHELKPTPANVIKLDQTERKLGAPTGRLAEWLKSHPNDLQVRLVNASYLQQEGGGQVAVPEYERMLKEDGENAIVLNNLAWLYHESGDERALELARRAYKIAPASPEIMDTYGWILFSAGKKEQGLDMLALALQAAPDNPDISYHHASALYGSGDSASARAILQSILQKHESFALRDDAEALLATLLQK